MPKIQNSTQSSYVKWVIEVYPFESTVPSATDFLSKANPVLGIFSSPDVASGVARDVFSTSFGFDSQAKVESGAQLVTSFGLVSVSLRRSKGTPDGLCSLNLVGPLSPVFAVGNWVIVSTFQTTQTDTSKSLGTTSKMIKFIGQIESISVSYSDGGDGAVVINSSVHVREWSALLTSKLLFDARSVEGAIATGSGALVASLLSAVDVGGKDKYESFSSLLKESFDPLETAHVVLRLMGVISEKDILSKSKKVDPTFNSLALSPPKIPDSVLKRLATDSGSSLTSLIGANIPSFGLGAAGASSQDSSPWANGFVRVISGVKPDKKLFGENWTGVFGGKNDASISLYASTVAENYQKSEIKLKSKSSLMSLTTQFTAWELLSTYCENVLYEVYTDIWHEYKAGTQEIVSRPVIVIRDKPFLMKQIGFNDNDEFQPKFTEQAAEAAEGWTSYDELPRIHIKPESISQFNLSSTFATSPNYIVTNLVSPYIQTGSFTASTISSTLRLDAEQSRFGGQELYPEMQFLSPDLETKEGKLKPNLSFEDWFKVVSETMRMWYSYLYRMASGSVTIKDDNYPLSVGFNLSFRVGYFDLVGHIDEISSQFSIDESGHETTTTEIKLSRIVYQPESNKKSGELRLMPMDGWGRFFDADFAKEANSAPSGQSIAGVGALVKSVTGFFS